MRRLLSNKKCIINKVLNNTIIRLFPHRMKAMKIKYQMNTKKMGKILVKMNQTLEREIKTPKMKYSRRKLSI